MVLVKQMLTPGNIIQVIYGIVSGGEVADEKKKKEQVGSKPDGCCLFEPAFDIHGRRLFLHNKRKFILPA
jgi:hypothetical protein